MVSWRNPIKAAELQGFRMAMGQQDETIAFLSNASHYGYPGTSIERIETHCSIVFLAGDRAYKLKRSVAFSALDYSTVERREAACRAELELNRRTAPELYLGIQAIRRSRTGALAFDGEGPAVDWVVVMRRIDQDDLFDHLADAGRLTPEMIRVLADEIARFHEAAEHTPGFGGADGIRAAIERNHKDQMTFESVLGRAGVGALHEASLFALKRATRLLDLRRREGKVRRCHGDLRLANICLFGDRPTLFDAIEFSDQLSCIDVLFDLAFLLMDLHHRGQGVLANILFNRYADRTGDFQGLAVLPLMLSIRAATRAYTLAGAVQRHPREDEARSYTAAARSHLALASTLLMPVSARLIAIGGVCGSTKASMAYELAATFQPVPGARVLRDNIARKELPRLPANARLPAADDTLTDRVYERLAAEAEQVLRAGFTAIVDAGFVQRAHRRAISTVASTASVPFIGLWLGPYREIEGDVEAGAGEWHAIQPGPRPSTMLAAAHGLAHADSTA